MGQIHIVLQFRLNPFKIRQYLEQFKSTDVEIYCELYILSIINLGLQVYISVNFKWHYHPPEELGGAGHGSLGGDIGSAPSEPVDIVGVQVFVLLLGCCCSRSNSAKAHPAWFVDRFGTT